MATVTIIACKTYSSFDLAVSGICQAVVHRRAIEHAGIRVIERLRAERVRDPVRDHPVSVLPPALRCQRALSLKRRERMWRVRAPV